MTNILNAIENPAEQNFLNKISACVAKGADNVQPYIRQQPQNKPARRRELRTWVKVAAGMLCVSMICAIIVMATL